MRSIERRFQIVLVALVVLHLAGSLGWPAALWGVSQMAVWPPALAVAWTAIALGGILAAPRLDFLVPRVPRRRVVVLALPILAALCFWIFRERTHFFGDGALIVRSGGLAPSSFARAPLLVRPMFMLTSQLEAQLGLAPEISIALLSVVSGGLAVWLVLRLSLLLGVARESRLAAAAVLTTSGAVALFLGHVEYYAPLVPALLAYLWLAILGLQGRAPLWPTWIVLAVLCQLHLAALALAPGQLYLAWHGMRRGERLLQLMAIPTAVGLGWLTRMLLGADGAGGWSALQDLALRRYLQPFFDPASNRHAFGLVSVAHAAAIANTLLLVAPLALAVAIVAPRFGRSPTHRFLSWSALGCVAFLFVFNPELGPYRDWDILAPFGFVYLAWAAATVAGVIESPHLASGPALRGAVVAVLLFIAGVHHLVPWVALHAHPNAAEAHLRLALANPTLWSRYARGILHEEFAITSRDRGDLAAAIVDYEAASHADPHDARYHLGLADSYAGVSDGRRAAEEYETAIRLRPNFAPAHNNYAAWLLRSDGDLEVALRHGRQAVLLAPKNPRFLATLGTAEMRTGNLTHARATLMQAHSIAPDMEAIEVRLEELRRLEREAASTSSPRSSTDAR